jgi:hypothetical protein
MTEKYGKDRTTFYTYGVPIWGGLAIYREVLLMEGVGLEYYGIFHEPLSYLVDFCEGGMESCQLITSTNRIESNKEATIFPNPTKGVCQISMNEEEIKSIRLYSAMGLFKSEFKRTHTIDLSNLQAGIYYLEITSEKGERIIKRVVKEN